MKVSLRYGPIGISEIRGRSERILLPFGDVSSFSLSRMHALSPVNSAKLATHLPLVGSIREFSKELAISLDLANMNFFMFVELNQIDLKLATLSARKNATRACNPYFEGIRLKSDFFSY